MMDNEKPDVLAVNELSIILDYYAQHPPPWIENSPSGVKKRKLVDNKDLEIAEEVFLLLNHAAEHFRNLWNWAEFASIYLNHNDTYVVWLACQCMGIIFQLTESDKNNLIYCYMEPKTNIEHMLAYNLKSCNFKSKDYLKSYITNKFISVEEVFLPSIGPQKRQNDLILVNSTKQNLRKLSIAVSAGKAVCLVGPVGSGKSSLVHYLANITGHTDENLLTVQLGNETDSKMMLGSYHCTDIPGEFIWQPGVLTKAVTEGLWLLLEDVDSASNDLAAVLGTLIESRSLTVPGYRDRIIPATGFQLFFTQRVITTTSGYYHKQNTATDLLEKHYIQINIEPLNKNELIEVIEIKFPVLKTISPKIIDVFLLFSAGLHNNDVVLNLKSNARLTSTRDLLKWCSRIIKDYEVTSNESALRVIQDAIDIFCCSADNSKMRLELACHIASLVGVVKTKAEFFLIEYKPTIVLDEKCCIIGRVTLPRNGSFLTVNDTSNSKFALTRSSSCLLERMACSIFMQESVLLVGETGTGKTSALQLLAKHTGNKLIVLNMNQHSDSVDLIGGYKPVELKIIIKPIRDKFERLFRAEFDVEQNVTFLSHISTCFNNHSWSNLIKLIKFVIQRAVDKNTKNNKPINYWLELNEELNSFEIKLKHCQTSMAFAFVEGSLIQAVKNGYWILLDEINLASSETLQCLSNLLESEGTVTIYEKTDFKPITRHPNFRLMAAMNPATDIGKKDLPSGIRNRFTEFFVDEIRDRSDLITLTACYLPDYSFIKLNDISKFYLIAKREAETSLTDGTGHKPHYSLRTFCRALSIASSNPCQSTQKSLYESFCLSFLTQLNSFSHKRVEQLIASTMFRETLIQAVINQPIPRPITKPKSYIQIEGYWIQKGDLEPSPFQKYILTNSVKLNLRDLVRVVSLSKFPVLIQGDTCVGKTSLITYLASASGNKLVRINNHAHTDTQEYIGSYLAQSITGKLVFKEGVLVEAMRKGHWIILDELNLAPTDVLESLNRVLDDNRELFIPETQTIVKAHPGFRLFATQNPPGLYGGRKILSRAFKNRFIEMHFDEIPADELETILFKRCEIPLSYAKKLISVMKELQSTRKISSAFSGKHGLITLRDLFRWGERYRLSNGSDNYNWNQHLIDEGFLVLASKVRKPEEEKIIIQILEKHFKCSLSLDRLFTFNENTSLVTRHILEQIQKPPPGFEHIYMSKNIRRMVVLACKAIEFREPVLLVGETGCGKTTVCQMIAAIKTKKLLSVNCHQHTESSDFLGGLRPIRNRDQENDQRLFEWVDGPLIEAITEGHLFLADEISLADDSVLERLNSLLEPERKLLVTEKNDIDINSEILAHTDFCFFGTMNPGGDYGKKELSPALRNRLTEIWCESCLENEDLVKIISHSFSLFHQDSLLLSQSMVDFVTWLKKTEQIRNYLKLNISIRDYLIWVKFIEAMMKQFSPTDDKKKLQALITFYREGAIMVFLDKKPDKNPVHDRNIKNALNNSIITKYQNTIDFSDLLFVDKIKDSPECFGCDGYYISRGNLPEIKVPEYSFDDPITKQNLKKLLRCMQIDCRAILLEGSPGVGKTSLIQAVSKASGHELIRINLSEQTDVSDLFGSDLPIDGGDGGSFEWRDGPFLRALKKGNWILLDELNLASQSVLEGLNAVLDHRGELYIPELSKTFIIESKKTRIFACQNPMSEGGARKGLPKSFLNRFLQIHLDILCSHNIVNIIENIYTPKINDIKTLHLEKVVDFTLSFGNKYNVDTNLRDILRWVDVTIALGSTVLDHLPLIFTDRLPSLQNIENEVFDQMQILLNIKCQKYEFMRVFPSAIMFNRIVVPRNRAINMPIDQSNSKLILRSHIHILNSLAVCVKMNWMPILVGSGSGKNSVIKTLAQLYGCELYTLSVNSALDTIEILGGFEQADYNRHLEDFAKIIENKIYLKVSEKMLNGQTDYIELLYLWNEYRKMTDVWNNKVTTMVSETTLFKNRTHALIRISTALNDFDITSSLQVLKDRVCSIGNLNSGGKFEWIDSILIKCLNNGNWLLIDNVNLCSPAVLDRLNGLLEPNGVLELGEKGIGSDGQIQTIKPHKDFRLFLAMDPKHGSISRAMKNRGVEICMCPLEEISSHDIYSLLDVQGIHDKTVIHKLIEIHKIMKNFVTGIAISINHLLRTAYLVSQNINGGKPVIEAIREICIDTYVHHLNGNSKQNALMEIDCILKEHSKIPNEIWIPNLKLIDILQSSNFCYINQQCNILEQHKYNGEISIEDLLLCYFGRSSSSDVTVRSQWLSKRSTFSDEAIKQFIKTPPELKFDLLQFVTKSVDYIDHKDLPFDFRYLPDVYFNKVQTISKLTPYAENKIHLMLDWALNKCLDQNFLLKKINEKKIMISNGGILHDYAILSNAFEDFINYFLNDHSVNINEFNSTRFKELIIWTRTIEKKIFENLKEKNEFVTVLVYSYFNVIVKHFIPIIESMIKTEKYAYLEQLIIMKNQVSKNYLTPKRYTKLMKSFTHWMLIPLHQCCKNHGDKNIEAYQENNNLITAIKLNNIHALITNETKIQRNNLLKFEYANCKLISNYKTEDINTSEFDNKEINLIPIWELIIERNIFSYINYNFINDKIQIRNGYDSLIKPLLKFVPTVSPFYYNSLKKNKVFSIEFLTESLKHSMNSVAIDNPELYFAWSPKKVMELEDQENAVNQESLYSFEQPLFTTFITNVLLKKTDLFCTFSPTPLRLIDNNKHNLVFIKSLIWNSSKWNSDIQFENIKSLIKMIELFFSALLPDDISSLEELHSLGYDEKCRSSFIDKVDYHESMITAIFDTAKELSNIKTNLDLCYHKRSSSNTYLIKQIQFSAGRLWVLSGMVFLEIFKDIGPVDPLEKIKVHIECSKAEINKLNSRLKAEKLFCEADGISDIFPFKQYYTQRLKFLIKDNKNVGYRPEPPMYNVILKDITRFSKMYGLDSNTYNLINANIMDRVTLVNEMENWLNSVTNFHNSLNERYAGYPDVLSGILLSVNQMRYGMRILKNQYKWAIPKEINFTYEEEILTLFGEFPRFCPNIIKMANIDDVLLMSTNDKFRWYKLCLEELNNMFYLSGHSCKCDQYINTIGIILDKFVNNWKYLQEEIENKNREEVSIYKQRSLCETIPLEIEIIQGVSQQFPTSKHDFNDIESPLTLDTDICQDSIAPEVYHLTDKDINDICKLHTDLVRPAALAFWLSASSVKFDQSEAVNRLKNSFSDRFCLFGKLLMSKFMYLDSSMDGKMMPWLLIATDIASNPQKIDNKGYYDFYRDSNLEFSKKTFEVITIVEEQIRKLISEWPEHPTLQTILRVVERIMDFNWDSPACRFLIGLELLLTKLHEWEMVAHKGVSLHEVTLIITQCIQEYRNLELSTWKDCLKTSLIKVQNNSSKWWFHLYSIFQTYLHNQESFPQLVIAIQKFMESSSLGEYIARLELLYTFHCDVVCRESSIKQTELCNASWNLFKYYSQFKDSINQQIESQSADIKNKLQGFIKIVKWNDINYWTVKETINKVQQTLHKYTREYQEILSKPASSAMITTSAILNTKTDRYTPPTFIFNNYLEKCETTLNIQSSKKCNVLLNINKYAKKLFTISENILTNCSYPTHITELNDFINSIMESANELRDLKVDPELSKVKQKSQAKNILQQKRKALSELFKALQNIGLSYKAGLICCEEDLNCSVEFANLPPIDINAALDSLTPKLVDDDLRCAWTDCEVYFLKSISQTSALKLSSETPKLGPLEMDRIKGFVNDLKTVTWNTKRILALNINSLVNFRSMIYLSDQITNSKSIIFNPSDDFQQPVNYLINGINILQQFKVAIQCCNENIDFKSTDSITTIFNLSSCAYYSKSKSNKTSNEILNDIDNMINLTQNSLNSLMDKKTYCAMKLSNVNFVTQENYKTAVDMCDKLREYIIGFYKDIWINDSNTLNKHNFKCQSFVTENNEQPLEEMNNFISQVLKSIEKLYKKQLEIKSENEEKKLLKYLIIQPLSSDLEDCDLASITNQFKNILKLSVGDNLLKVCRPLFEQYILLVQYFITQQTMVYRVLVKMSYLLSTLFTDLASNGFCIPDELLEGEENAQFDCKNGGLGLDDGEGKKDVSNEIESQDQLEDAKQNYNDQQELDKDLKEEEHGVEMSDDFDGKLHDVEQNTCENEENDGEDCDKEMGETSEGADTLDEKLWGNDSEDENGDEQEINDLKEDVDGQDGEDIGNKSLGPKSEIPTAEANEHNDETDDQKHNNLEKDINELDENGEPVGEDHIDSMHGNMQPPPEPEPMDLPNDLQLDEGEMNDNEEKFEEDNPFDIDVMKENVDENINNDDGVEFEELKENLNNLEELSDEETKSEDNEHLEGNQFDDTNNDDSNKLDDEVKETDTKINLEEANPSNDKPSQIETQPSNLDNSGSKDQVCQNADGQDKNEEFESNTEEATGPETQGVGQSQRESKDTKEGHSIDQNIGNPSEESGTQNKRRLKPGEKDIDRTLAENIGPMKKRLKTTDIQEEYKNEDNHNNVNENNDAKKSELFKHIKESKNGDTETLDAATNEQLEKMPVPNIENQIGEELKEDDEMEVEEMEVEEISNENKTKELGEEILPEKIKSKIKNKQSMNDSDCQKIEDNLIEKHTIDGEVVLTHTAERGMDTMFHTMDVTEDNDEFSLSKTDFNELIKNQFHKWVENQNDDGLQNNEEWHKFMNTTSSLSQELSEQLRLVLEPSKASRLQGDFRTGRRINMRRVIPYIASQFRKDKIWLRRTKPSKRQYQIIMAVDNSSSMIDSMAKDLTFKSLALVSKALTLVEAGELGVMSFGEHARIVHPLGEPFSDQTGAKLMHEFTFNEDNTKVGELVELATAVFENRGRLDDSDKPAQLLVIMSDGRRIKCEGPDILSNAIRSAKINGIFIVFIIIDNPTSKDSILDMKIPIFENNSVRIESYMDHFPFSFYVVLRDVDKMPGVLSDALREWFDLVTN
ncbi:ATPase, dynein-related, AAA domain,von Willebrand factor, type A,AAA+ ATPase domain,P-loop [Cinara cedri]|uniref:Midasin n=1 Tax=Cinara cedri TaxID=506608 RepID=A0A5E4MH42_9HEMI|nr:ATPase, dynein-related, AAA domain,von Willebrand factor, type A,AAA+ ATPase domain,P-loop [Cinara cedri]